MSQDEFPRANVTTTSFHNTYVYSWYNLWLGYGIAILLTAAAVAQGLLAIFSSGASYSNNFSTVMRSSWNAKLSVDVSEVGDGCRDPLPDYLAKATVLLPVTPHRSAAKSGARVQSPKYFHSKIMGKRGLLTGGVDYQSIN